MGYVPATVRDLEVELVVGGRRRPYLRGGNDPSKTVRHRDR